MDESTLTGWTLCWSSTYEKNYTDPVNELAAILSACDGDYLLLAAGPVASTVYDVVAAAPRADVIFDTGTDTTTTHNANGTEWYYNSDHSWGFALGGDTVNKDTCDWIDSVIDGYAGVNGEFRLCWHTSSGFINTGWRSGLNDDLSFDSTFRRAIYEAFDAPAVRLFGTTGQGGGTSTLVELDPTTGALISTIGNVGYLVNGLDYDPVSDKLYATTGVNDANFPSGLITIDMTTGAGTPVVSLGSPEGCIPTNLRANAGGTLFAWSECGGEDDLVVINPATGDTFVVGESGLGTAAYGMSFDASNVLYFVNVGGTIYTVDKYTGNATYVSSMSAPYAHHGDFHPDTGRYWGIDAIGGGSKNIHVVNVGSGAIDATLPTVNNLHTLTFVPGNVPAVDVVEPVLTVPANITVPQNAPGGAVVNYTASATDETSPANPDARRLPSSGSVFPVGTTTVKCFALDDQGNADFGNFDVTVTAAPGGNLLKKPDFASASIFPTPWKPFGFKPPYGAALDCAVYNMGPCSVLFQAGNHAALQQVGRTGLAGDTFSFGMYSAGQNAGGTYRVELLFYDNFNKLLGSNYLNFTPGTHGFELRNGTAVAPVNYNKIIFRFVYNSPNGRAWFDDAFLYFLGNAP